MSRFSFVNLILKRLKSTQVSKKQSPQLINTPNPNVFETDQKIGKKKAKSDSNATPKQPKFDVNSYLQNEISIKETVESINPLEPDDAKIWENDTNLLISRLKQGDFDPKVSNTQSKYTRQTSNTVAKKTTKEAQSDKNNTKLVTKDQTKTKQQPTAPLQFKPPTKIPNSSSKAQEKSTTEKTSDENSTPSLNSNVKLPLDSDIKQKKLDEMRVEYMKERSKQLSNQVELISKYKLDTEFLYNALLDYPVIANEDIERYGYVYDKSNIELLPKYLIDIEKKEINSKNANIPSTKCILDMTRDPEIQMKQLLWRTDQICEKGKESKKQKELSDRDQFFKDAIKTVLGGKKKYEEIEISKKNEAFKPRWQSMEKLLSDISKPTIIEHSVTHPNLFYTSFIDCIAYYKDELCIIHWKHKDDKIVDSESLNDDPLQLIASLGAYLHDPSLVKLRKMDRINTAIIVYTYENKLSDNIVYPTIYTFNFLQQLVFWSQWLERLKKFWIAVNEYQNKPKRNVLKIKQ